jgi:HlyD family secretion protein
MTANVKILVARRPGVLRIPNAALRYRPPNAATAREAAPARKSAGPDKAVWILDSNGTPQRVAISTGETDGAFTEVTAGSLHDGDRVIVAALSGAAPTSGAAPGRAGGRGPGF